ncbi:MAG TPA: ATP-binding protein, partial [Bdellovibrio sp.]|nr:ATP-binding protein [Bdellovibrio sp.]
ITSTLKDNQCKIIIADNGIGFETQFNERIFKVFERLHGNSVYPGTGIGLTIVRKIIGRHHGTIIGQGVPGKGSTFTITLLRKQEMG